MRQATIQTHTATQTSMTTQFISVILLIYCITAPFSKAINNISITGLLIIFLSTKDWKYKFSFFLQNKILLAGSLLTLLMLLSALFSSATTHEFIKYSKHYLLFPVLFWMLLYFFSKYKPAIEKKTCIAILTSATILFFIMAINTLHPTFPRHGDFPSITGQFNTAYLFIIVAYSIFRFAPQLKEKPYYWPLLIIACCCLIGDTCLNRSRTGYVIEICLIVYFFYKKYAIKGIFIGTMAALCFFFSTYLLSPMVKNRTDQAISDITNLIKHQSTTSSQGIRAGEYIVVYQVFKHNPIKLLTGFGAASYPHQLRKYFNDHPTIKEFKTGLLSQRYLESDYLKILFSLGVPGLCLFCGMLWLIYSRARRYTNVYQTIIQVTILTIGISAFFNYPYSDTRQGLMMCFYLALMLSMADQFGKHGPNHTTGKKYVLSK